MDRAHDRERIASALSLASSVQRRRLQRIWWLLPVGFSSSVTVERSGRLRLSLLVFSLFACRDGAAHAKEARKKVQVYWELRIARERKKTQKNNNYARLSNATLKRTQMKAMQVQILNKN